MERIVPALQFAQKRYEQSSGCYGRIRHVTGGVEVHFVDNSCSSGIDQFMS